MSRTDLAEAQPFSGPELTRRRLLELGLVGFAALVVPACGAASPGGTGTGGGTSGAGPGTTAASTDTAASTGTAGAGTTGTAGATGSSAAGSSSAGTTGGTTGRSLCTNDANTFVTSIADTPALRQVGQVAFFLDGRYSDPLCGQNAFLIVQKSAGEYVALSASCSHQCSTPPTVQQNGGVILCTLHGSEFTFDGAVSRAVVRGQQALPTLPICIDGNGNIYVQLA